MENKRGESKVGFATALVLSIVMFTIAAIVALAIVTNVVGSGLITSTTTSTVTVTNESFNGLAQGAWINLTGYTLSGYNTSWSAITMSQAWNQSSSTIVPADNYTVSAAGVVTNTTTAEPFNSQWFNVTLSYSYTHTYNTPAQNTLSGLENNTTGGINTVALKFTTVFSIIAIVLIMLVLGVLVAVWRKTRLGNSAV